MQQILIAFCIGLLLGAASAVDLRVSELDVVFPTRWSRVQNATGAGRVVPAGNCARSCMENARCGAWLRFSDRSCVQFFPAVGKALQCALAAVDSFKPIHTVQGGSKTDTRLLAFSAQFETTGTSAECETHAHALLTTVDPADLEAAIARPTYTALVLHDPACPFSRALIPHVALMQAQYSAIDTLWVPSSALSHLDLHYGVSGTPALLLFRNGSVVGKRHGPRTFADLSALIISKTALVPLGWQSPDPVAMSTDDIAAHLAQAISLHMRDGADASVLTTLTSLGAVLCPLSPTPTHWLVSAAGLYSLLYLTVRFTLWR